MSEEAKAATDDVVELTRRQLRSGFSAVGKDDGLALIARIDAEVRAREAAERNLANANLNLLRVAALEADLAEAKARADRQRVANDKLQRKYNSGKGGLKAERDRYRDRAEVAERRLAAAERLAEACRNLVPSAAFRRLDTDEAREALRAFEETATKPDPD